MYIFQEILGGHGWTVCHFSLGFHLQSNTLDVLVRPMTNSELCVEYEGCSWLENRLHVIRGSSGPRTKGPFEIRVNGGPSLDLRSTISGY